MNYRVAGTNGFPTGAPMEMSWNALHAVFATVGTRRPESGGKLFARAGSSRVEVYDDDPAAMRGGLAVYRPDVEWAARRLVFWGTRTDPYEWVGDVHSHPGHACGFLSGEDLAYIARIFRANATLRGRQRFLAPVLTFDPDGVPVVWPWTVLPDVTVMYAPFEVAAMGSDIAMRGSL